MLRLREPQGWDGTTGRQHATRTHTQCWGLMMDATCIIYNGQVILKPGRSGTLNNTQVASETISQATWDH